ncbi:4-alpha-glucanotransferase [bacterium HR09]|nr:4-alpha-glucanotransferase [bacterium HR09]
MLASGMRWNRSYGVLLPVTSLPESPILGDFGPQARRFGQFLKSAGAHFWQVLPLNPLGPGSSPYSSPSSFAGNPLLVSPVLLCQEGLLDPSDLAGMPPATREAQYEKAYLRERLLALTFARFQKTGWHAAEFNTFCQRQAWWLEDWAIYAVAKKAFHGAPFWQWPEDMAHRRPQALQHFASQNREDIEKVKFEQFLFQHQWEKLRADLAPLQIIGDLPFYVALDSADVWAHLELFNLGPDLRPLAVAGVPPDYFSPDGQLWGNPTYRWDAHQASSFAWWRARLQRALALYDLVRLDHFRGFAAAWEVPAGETTARHGQWVPTPGQELFRSLGGELPFIAEDLGHITEDVIKLRDSLGFPGMAVLQFAFNPRERSLFLPHYHRQNLVVYTGTHDNNTAQGWWEEEATEEVRAYFRAYVGNDDPPHRALIRLAMASVANLALIPMQDVLGLPSSCRVNRPGIPTGNWTFRLLAHELDDSFAPWLHHLAWIYER